MGDNLPPSSDPNTGKPGTSGADPQTPQAPQGPTTMQPLRLRELFKPAWAGFKERRADYITLITVGMVLPQLVHTFYFDGAAQATVAKLREAVPAGSVGGGNAFNQVQLIAGTALEYFGAFALTLAMLWAWFLVTYFGIVYVAVGQIQGQRFTVPQALKKGLRCLFPSGIALTLMLIPLAFFVQFLTFIAIIAAVLALIIPVMVVWDGRGALSSLWQALTIQYAKGTPYHRWNVLVTAMSIGALFYAGMFGLSLINEGLADLDTALNLPRDLWAYTLGNFPAGPVYIWTIIVATLFGGFLTGFLPVLTTELYAVVTGRRPVAQDS